MFKIIGAAVLISALAGTAQAADVIYEQAPLPVPAAERWAGAYGGIHAGYVWGDASFDSADPAPDGSLSVDGFIGGVQAGYNWQSGSLVFGVEGSLSYLDVTGSSAALVVPGGGGATITSTSDSQWGAAAKLRGGIALDGLLLYASGGVAVTRGEAGAIISAIGTTEDYDTQTMTGWTVGLGAEAFVTERTSIRLDWSYYDYGTEEFFGGDSIVESDAHVVTVGLNYHF